MLWPRNALELTTGDVPDQCCAGSAATARRRSINMERSRSTFDGVKVFFATMLAQRAQLGEAVTSWLAAQPALQITDVVVRQSSDSRFHCLSIVIFYREASAAAAA